MKSLKFIGGKMELPAVAKNFHAFCKKCDSDRYHKVLAHTGPKTIKMQCEVCGSTKSMSFKADGTPVASKTTGTRGESAKKAAESRRLQEHENHYNELSSKFSDSSPLKYSIKGQFVKDAVIDHPKFGVGFVLLATEAKIDVVFKDSVRSLVHRRS